MAGAARAGVALGEAGLLGPPTMPLSQFNTPIACLVIRAEPNPRLLRALRPTIHNERNIVKDKADWAAPR